MERSSPGARECHELRNYVAKQLKRERWLRLGRNVKISRFSKISFSISVSAGSPFHPQISPSNIVILVDSVYGICASRSCRLISPSSPSFIGYILRIHVVISPLSTSLPRIYTVLSSRRHLSVLGSRSSYRLHLRFMSCGFIFICKPCCLQLTTTLVFMPSYRLSTSSRSPFILGSLSSYRLHLRFTLSRHADLSSSASLVACSQLQPRYSRHHIVFRHHHDRDLLSELVHDTDYFYGSHHADSSSSASLVACYILAVMSFSTSLHNSIIGLIIAIIFYSRNSSSIPIASTGLHLAFTIVLHHQDCVVYIYGVSCRLATLFDIMTHSCMLFFSYLAFITAVMHPRILSISCLLSPLSSSAVVISSYINVAYHNTIQIMSRLAGARLGEGSTVMDVVIAT